MQEVIYAPDGSILQTIDHQDRPKSPLVISGTAFMEHCWKKLGSGATGRARFGAIVKAMIASEDDEVRAIAERYEAARSGTFEKTNVKAFLTILKNKGIASIQQSEIDAIMVWPEG